MVNHIRTLLLNCGRDGYSPADDLEEYIPPDFVPRIVPTDLQLLRRTLFGRQPDRLFVNMRMQQFMQILHASPFADLLTADDSRITYDPLAARIFSQYPQTTCEPTVGDPATFSIDGAYVVDPAVGTATRRWLITFTNTETAHVVQRYSTAIEYAMNVTHNSVKLPGSDLVFRVSAITPGDAYTVTASSKPPDDLGSLMSRVAVFTAANLDTALFSLPVSGTSLRLRNAITQQTDAVSAFAAVLLAMVYRLEQSQQGT